MMATRSPNRSNRRAAFTLIELMIVIVILSILAALILPAIGRVRNNVLIGKVKTEITALESAIATFKGKYGVDPPSRIVLYETPSAGWTSATPSPDAVDSRAKIRQIWPQFDFSMVRNLNGNGVATDVVELTQGECLVFFLGGILKRPEDLDNDGTLDAGEDMDGDGRLGVNATVSGSNSRSVCTGFSKNPYNPFASGGNRETAIYDFDTARMVDAGTPDGMPEFVDSLSSQTQPYLYFSSYDGIGYQAVEFGFGGPICPYLQSPSTTAPTTWASVQSIPRWKPKSYQIISPGMDRQYGTFGPFAPEAVDGQLQGGRTVEADNITNFHSGTLGR
ncbi:MAG: type II secretion system protein [Candidatus Saccharimonas sp.]|nr:type II secretion system protein [Planctomycetaceae bacterium]